MRIEQFACTVLRKLPSPNCSRYLSFKLPAVGLSLDRVWLGLRISQEAMMYHVMAELCFL